MGSRTKHFGASFKADLEAALEDLKAMEIGENNETKKVPVLVLKTYEKADAQKWTSPVGSQLSCLEFLLLPDLVGEPGGIGIPNPGGCIPAPELPPPWIILLASYA